MKVQKDESGFSIVAVVLVLIIVALVSVVGFMVYKIHSINTKDLVATTTLARKDPYVGWKSYCDASTANCFKYPASWGEVNTLSGLNVKAFVQNKTATINVSYSEPVDGTGGLDSYATNNISSLYAANAAYRVVGGYYTVGNNPAYDLIDSSQVQKYSLVAGKTTTISNAQALFFTKGSNKASLTVSYNNTTGAPGISTSQANDWFNSADGKLALLIAQSYYSQSH